MKKIYYYFATTIFLVFIVFSCKTTETTPTAKNSQTTPTSLALSGIIGGTSDFVQATNTYTFTVPTGTNIKTLALTLSLPTGATVLPASGSAQDFTNPVTYTITAENGTTVKYIVKIVVQTSPKSSAKQILNFSFDELNPVVKATINQSTFDITAEIPATANLKALKPTITLSDKATVSPTTGVSQDFTKPINLIVTAEDGTKQTYITKITQKTTVLGGAGIYVAGYEYIDGAKLAKYWKNGVEVILNKDKTYAEANSIFVTENDVYVAGFLAILNNEVATYWKNGTPVSLTDGSYMAMANSIVVNGTDIYVAGFEFGKNGKPIAKYWKNGIEVALTNGNKRGVANSIFVNGKDVYVAGKESPSGKEIDEFGNDLWVAKYWKNGNEIILSSNGSNDVATSIVLSGSDVFVAGYTYQYGARNWAKYWKNDVAVTLTRYEDGGIPYYSYANSIMVQGKDIYMSGITYGGGGFATYWKNDVPIFLEKSQSYASSIFVNGNDIYVAGILGGVQGSFVYWKNGLRVFLKTSESGDNIKGVTSIFVK